MSKVETDFFYRSGMDCRGMTVRDNASLAPGEFRILQNLRVRPGALRRRGGIVDKGATGLAAGSVVGAAKVVLNGTVYQLVAIDTGAAVRCYYGADTSFTEFTGPASNNKYGNTRFATGNRVVFDAVRDTTASTITPFTAAKTGLDVVFASDGATCVVWDPSASSTDNGWTAVHQSVWHPGLGKVRQEATYPYYTSLAASNLAAGATTGTGTIGDNTAHAITGGLCPTWGFTAVNDAAVLTVTTGTNLAKNKQVWMVWDCPDDPTIMEYLKIEVYDSVGTTFRTLWDGSSATAERPVTFPIDKGFYTSLFPVDRSVLPDQVYTDVRITYKGSANYGAAVAFNLIAIGGSGTSPGGAQHAVSLTNTGARSESVALVCDVKGGVSLKDLGCQDTRNYVQIVDTALSYFSYTVWAQQPSDADRDKGVDYLLVYRRQALGKAFYHVASDQLASYDTGSHAWSHVSSRSALQDIKVTVDTEPFAPRTAPDGYNVAAPACQTTTVASGRLFCGAARPQSAGSSAKPADVYISEQDYPFRFREVLKVSDGEPDPVSGTCAKFPGEKVQRVIAMAGSLQNAETAVVFTDQNVWALPGPDSPDLSRPRRLSTKGTFSPGSVFAYNNRIVYLDEDRRLVYLVPGQEPVDLSTGRYDAILEAIPTSRLDDVYGWVFRGRYYMSYTLGGGSSNKAVLVYDFLNDTFVRDTSTDTLSWGPFFSLDIGVSGQLRFWGETGNLYEHDSASTTLDPNSQPVSYYIEGRAVGDLWSDRDFGRLGVHCLADSGKTVSAYWTGRPSGFGLTHNDTVIPLEPKVSATVTPASTSAGSDTVTFSEAIKVPSGTTCTPRTTAGGLTAGTVYYLYKSTATLYSFHTTYSDSLTGASPVNLTASIGAVDIIGTHVRGYAHEAATGALKGITDGAAYPTWTGAVSAGHEIYALTGEHAYGGEGAVA